MLLEEFLPDTVSVKSEDMKEKHPRDGNDYSNKYSDSDDDLKENSDGEDSSPKRCEYGDCNEIKESNRSMTKTVLPIELEELVKEALAELKPLNEIEK